MDPDTVKCDAIKHDVWGCIDDLEYDRSAHHRHVLSIGQVEARIAEPFRRLAHSQREWNVQNPHERELPPMDAESIMHRELIKDTYQSSIPGREKELQLVENQMDSCIQELKNKKAEMEGIVLSLTRRADALHQDKRPAWDTVLQSGNERESPEQRLRKLIREYEAVINEANAELAKPKPAWFASKPPLHMDYVEEVSREGDLWSKYVGKHGRDGPV
jgi:asparagine synthetase B (glutamine-hydrolysing)